MNDLAWYDWGRADYPDPPASTTAGLNAGGGVFKPVAMGPHQVEDAAPEFDF